jgi:hypothetical protein
MKYPVGQTFYDLRNVTFQMFEKTVKRECQVEKITKSETWSRLLDCQDLHAYLRTTYCIATIAFKTPML